MDGRSSQRRSDRIILSKKGNSVEWKSSARSGDRTFQCCNRRGCSGRMKTSPNVKTVNEVTAQSSSGSSVRPYVDGKRKLASQPKGGPSESSLSVDSAASNLMSAPNSSSSGYQSKLKKKSVKATVTEDGASNGSSNVKASISSSPLGKGKTLGSISGYAGRKYGMRSMPSNSTPNVVPSSSSSSDTKSAAARNVTRKRSKEEETNGISHRLDRKKSLPSSSAAKGHAASFGSSCQKIAFGRSSSSPSSSKPSLTSSRSRGLSSGDNDHPRERTPHAAACSSEPRYSHCRDSSPHSYRSDSDEVLFALELLEQNVELTPQQVRLLETSSIPISFSRYDRHQEMRLDIDNMSYEELLALGETMGTVSTALSEEEISKCLQNGIHQLAPSSDVEVNGDDAKCSICQEEYEVGDETGTLIECKHGYHMSCIARWFQAKNWCPVCKASAVGPSESSSLS